MHEFNHHFQQLPNFIQSELVWYVGSHHGLSLTQVLTRHITAADHWIARKHADHRHSPDHSDIFGNGPLGKQEMEALKSLVDTQMQRISQSSFAQGLTSRLMTESIRCLNHFKNSLVPIQSRAQAQEAARWRARQQAEQAARQLAQRQAEETARQLARHQAEETVLSVVRPRIVEMAVKQLMVQVKATLSEADKTLFARPLGKSVISVAGPKAIATAMDSALIDAELELRAAINDFAQATGAKIEAFSAMLYAFKQNGLDTQSMGAAALQH